MVDGSIQANQEELVQSIMLESIFAPQTREKRDQKLARDNPPGTAIADSVFRFAHYTTADAAIKIIESKRLWMRNTSCMNDFREVRHGYDFLWRYFSQPEKRAGFLAAMNSIVPTAGENGLAFFDSLWGHIHADTYITCLSEHDAKQDDDIGRLSMWRASGIDLPRVALVFAIPALARIPQNMGIVTSPCAYLKPGDGDAILDRVVANVTREQAYLRSVKPEIFFAWIFQSLLIMTTCTKHHGFEEEREWRAIHTPALKLPTVVKPLKTVIQGIPQTVFELPFDRLAAPQLADLDLSLLLNRVIIGPTVFGSVMGARFIEALRAIGVAEAEKRVFNSNIPLRT